jgi:hypothetical protein
LIPRLQKDKKVYYLMALLQIPYFIVPGVLLLFGILFYFLMLKGADMFVSLADLLINSKKYKYVEGKEYSEEYLMLETPLYEI